MVEAPAGTNVQSIVMELIGGSEDLVTAMSTFDPTSCDHDQLRDLLRALTRLQRATEHLRGRCALRLTEDGRWCASGSRSASAWLAAETGERIRETARLLSKTALSESVPETAEVARLGAISTTDAARIARVAGGDSTRASSLLDMVCSHGSDRLDKACDELLAASRDREADRRHAAHIVGNRALRHWMSGDGVAHLHWQGSPITLGEMLAAIHPYRIATGDPHPTRSGADALPMALRATPRAESPQTSSNVEQASSLGSDSCSVSESASGGERVAWRRRLPRARATVRVHASALLRGYVEHGETCDVVGVGRVPVELVRQRILAGAQLIGVVVDGDCRPLRVTGSCAASDTSVLHGIRVIVAFRPDEPPIESSTRVHDGEQSRLVDLLSRLQARARSVTGSLRSRVATQSQRIALTWSNPACSFPGCGETIGLEVDHRVPWREVETTQLSNLQFLCHFHHRHKTLREQGTEPGPESNRPDEPSGLVGGLEGGDFREEGFP